MQPRALQPIPKGILQTLDAVYGSATDTVTNDPSVQFVQRTE